MDTHNFKLVGSWDLSQHQAQGRLYRHSSGMEVFHVEAREGEYFFSYAFRTLPEDSSGVFHILEHTVLSGCRRWPATDPFSLFDAHSCNSYMNALTCPDMTLYPAASPVRKDFDNLFLLYTDSVFHPLLRRSTFESEGISVAREGFEGVVFNEMLGDDGQCESVVANRSRRDLFEGSPYFFSSGGDVEAMTGLSYEKYLDTYRRFYCPANCRLFIYGRDVGLEEKLRMLDEDYLSTLESGKAVRDPDHVARWTAPRRETVGCQATRAGEKGDFMLSFLTRSYGWDGYDNLLVSVLVDALLGGPANPLYSALTGSRLGKDLCDQSGMSADFDEIPFSVGMSGVDEADAASLEAFIMESLGRIAREGIGADVVEGAMRRQEFLLQEIHGGIPAGMRLFLKCVRGWLRGLDLGEVLDFKGRMAALRSALAADPLLFEHWIEDNLLDNPHRLSLYVRPEEDYMARKEESLAQAFAQRRGQWYERVEEAVEEVEVPTLHLCDIKEDEDRLDLEDLGGGLFFLAENTASISYLNLVVDLSDLSSDELGYAVILSRYILIAGLVGEDASSFHGRMRLESGGYYAYLETGRASDGEVKAFFVISIKCLTRQSAKCLALLGDWLRRLDFSHIDQVEDALNDLIGDYESYIEESGSSFATSLATACLTPSLALGERLMGIADWESLSHMSSGEAARGMEALMGHFTQRGRMELHISAMEEDRGELAQLGHAFLEGFGECTAKPSGYGRVAADGPHRIWCRLPSQVAYNALAMSSSPYQTREQEAESLYASILSKTRLWQELRLCLGAYGCEANVDVMEEVFTVASYRDPHVALSFEAMEKAMRSVSVTDEELDNAKMVRFGRLLRPLSPSQKATLALRRHVYRITDEMRKWSRATQRSLTVEDINEAARRLTGRLGEASYASLSGEGLFGKEPLESAVHIVLPG